jgi:hypothetical protein
VGEVNLDVFSVFCPRYGYGTEDKRIPRTLTLKEKGSWIRTDASLVFET